jgi:peroxiredoxin
MVGQGTIGKSSFKIARENIVMPKFPSCLMLAALVLAGFAMMAIGQTTAPATRPSTVGTITATASDVVPLDEGASVPKLTLKAVDGSAYDLNASVAKKPTVLIFYRGGWCPFCNQQMSGLQGVVKDLNDAGYQLLAISPDKPEELAKSIDKHALTYTLLSDSDAAAIQAFGLAFKDPPSLYGRLELYSGQTHHALPVPAVYIVGTDGTVKFVYFDPNYKKRMDPAEIVEQAKAALTK